MKRRKRFLPYCGGVIFQLAIYELGLRLFWMDRAEIARDAVLAIAIAILMVIVEHKVLQL